jgi:hypothetical protein
VGDEQIGTHCVNKIAYSASIFTNIAAQSSEYREIVGARTDVSYTIVDDPPWRLERGEFNLLLML